MLAFKLSNIVKRFGERIILNIKDLKIYDGEKIGIVGLNGCGKTTLLDIMAGTVDPDEGTVKHYKSVAYIPQLEGGMAIEPEDCASSLAREFQVADGKVFSGGEETRLKIARALSSYSGILLADEPTANLDVKGVQLLEEKLIKYSGTMLLVSHDRELLNRLCHKILEVADGKITVYQGNYNAYIAQKAELRVRAEFEYEQYIGEKKRLTQAMMETKGKSTVVRKTPKRMGNSEARLHKMGDQKAKACLDRKAKAIESRIEKLAVKERPAAEVRAKLTFSPGQELFSKIIIEASDLTKQLGGKMLFNNAEFCINKGQKTALIGDNGTGKTTLLKMIVAKDSAIKLSSKLRIGYFSQNLNILDENRTILENAMLDSIYDENFTRLTLARLLFCGSDVYKKAHRLSGGELVRVCFAKLLLSGANMLILDEPTNYLDVYSLEAVEKVLRDYQGELLFVSHDRQFVNSVATHLLIINNGKITPYIGSYEHYLNEQAKEKTPAPSQNHRIVLENRLSELISRLSAPGKKDEAKTLDAEYQQILLKLKELR